MDSVLILIQLTLSLVFAFLGAATLARSFAMARLFERLGAPRALEILAGGLALTCALGLVVGLWQPIWAAGSALLLCLITLAALVVQLRAGQGGRGSLVTCVLLMLCALVAFERTIDVLVASILLS